MSKVIADTIQGRATGNEAPDFPKGATVTGVVTATSFSGNATGLTGTPSVTVNLLTATDANVGGALTVGGVLTYEDVTNVDAIGVITARTGVKVTAGGIDIAAGGLEVTGVGTFTDHVTLADNKKIIFGDGSDFSIQHNTNENYIQSDSGHIYIRANVDDDEGDNIYIQPKSGENSAIFTHDGSVELYQDNSKKLETTNAGTLVSGVSSCYGLSITKGLVEEKGKFDSGGSPSGTFNHDVLDYGMVYRTDANMAGTFTINLRGDGSTTFNSIMQIGQSSAFTFYHGTNNTSYVLQNFQIDGVNQTEKWNGGSAPSAASASGTDVYTFNILKTADATYTVFATFSNFV